MPIDTDAALDAILAKARPNRPDEPERRDRDPYLVRLDEVEPEPVSWLWKNRIALGKLTMLAGDPGLGKSTLALDIAARVSVGQPWPDDESSQQEPGGVVIMNAEDGVIDTVLPRLIAAGADRSRIVAFEAVHDASVSGFGAARSVDLSTDLDGLEDAIRSVDNPRLVIVDPITAYTGGVDSHKNAELRGLLAPLSSLAERLGVAVLAVSHLNKAANGPAIYRTMGSLAFVAAARAAWAVCKDQEDPTRRLFLPLKNNLGPDTGGLAYRVTPADSGVGVIDWESGRVDLTADAALAMESPSSGALDEAEAWLRDVLSDGPVQASEVKERAKRDGVAVRTLERAKKSLKVVSDREGFASNGRWLWALPKRNGESGAADTNRPQALADNGDVGEESGGAAGSER